MLRILLTLFIGISSLATTAQSILTDLHGDELLEALNAEYKPEIVFTYGETRDTMYLNVYRDDEGFIECYYTGHKVFLPLGRDPSAVLFNDEDPLGITAEHIYPQSKGAGEGAARSDMHHLVPCKWQANEGRSNYPFAEVDDTETDRWFYNNEVLRSIPLAEKDEYSELLNGGFGNVGRWEPREERKGDIARSVFYFYTMYKQEADDADDDFFSGMKDVLYDWHLIDPVDSLEQARNELKSVFQQGKLNPFILDCTLVDRAYFDGTNTDCSSNFSTSTIQEKKTDFNLYPNPVLSTVTISVDKLVSSSNLKIYDSNGRLVKQFGISVGDNVLDLSGLSQGNYQLTLGQVSRMIYKM